MIYSSEITGKVVREALKSLPTDNWNEDRFTYAEHDSFELAFECETQGVTKGDFILYTDHSCMETRVVLKSQQSKYSCDYAETEWKLSEMTSKDFRFIEDKIRRAQKRVACNSLKNCLVNEYSLTLDVMKYNHQERNWITTI